MSSLAGSGAERLLPDELGATGDSSAGLDTGAAGRTVFLPELHSATGDRSFLDGAAREGLSLVQALEAGQGTLGLYDGLAGIGFALAELAMAVDEGDEFRVVAERTFERIAEGAVWEGGAAHWNRSNDVLKGTAGIGLAVIPQEVVHPGIL